MQKFEYFIMDGRARFNPSEAAVYEALGRTLPRQNQLSRDWGGMGACVVRAPVVAELPDGGSKCGDFEYLGDLE